jgi:hypothetical protein
MRRGLIAAVMCSALMVPAAGFAQTGNAQGHIVSTAGLSKAVSDQAATDARNRDVIRKSLERNDVREVAGRLGLDIKTASNAVSTMTSAELARAAAPANDMNAAELAGGDQVVIISLTTLLLIVIIVILVAK